MSELIKKEVEVPRELEEILVCLKVVVREIKKGSSISEIAAHALPPFIEAVKGAESVPSTVKNHMKAAVDCGLLFGSDLAFLFLEDSALAPVVPKPLAAAVAKALKSAKGKK